MKRLLASFLIAVASLASGAEPRPFAKTQPIAVNEARWTSGFWFDRFELCRTNTLPALGRLMEGTNYSQFFRNFEIAAGLAEGRASRPVFMLAANLSSSLLMLVTPLR